MDRVGFRALDFTSSTHMAVSVRFHREDPWERLRLVSAAMPNTPLNLITTGMRFISWVPAGEDLMRLSFRLAVRNGIRRFQIADPSNDPRSLVRLARMIREEGAEEVVVGLTYSISPVHTHDYYAERARAVAGSEDIDRLYLKDPGGLLTPDAVRELIPASSRRSRRDRSSCTATARSGSGRWPTSRGCAPASARCTPRSRRSPAAPRTRPPSRRCATSRPRVCRTRLDPEALAAVSDHFRALARERGLPLGVPAEYDAAYYRHQMPGGMVTTTRRMLAEVGRPGAVRRRARGGHARARGDGLPDHGHAGLPVRGHAGDDERDRRRALARRLGRDGSLLPRALLRARRRRWTRRSPSACCRCRAPPSCATLGRSAWRARASASARVSRRRSCCCD